MSKAQPAPPYKKEIQEALARGLLVEVVLKDGSKYYGYWVTRATKASVWLSNCTVEAEGKRTLRLPRDEIATLATVCS